MSNNIIQRNEDLIKHDLKDLVRSSVEETLNALLDKEADELVNAGKYERSGERQGYRSVITKGISRPQRGKWNSMSLNSKVFPLRPPSSNVTAEGNLPWRKP